MLASRFGELVELGLIKKPPRMAVINAAGADTLYRVVNQEKLTSPGPPGSRLSTVVGAMMSTAITQSAPIRRAATAVVAASANASAAG